MRRISFISVFIFFLLGMSLWFAQSFSATWEPRLRSLLIQRAEQTLHSPVTVDHLSISSLHRVILSNVTVWGISHPSRSEIFHAQTISLTINPLNLPEALFHRNPSDIIGVIRLDTPWIHLSEAQLHFYQHLFSSSMPANHPLFFTLAWDHGVFQYKSANAPHGSWSLYQSRGLFRIRGPKTDAFVTGMPEQAQRIQFSFSLLGHHWHAGVHVEEGNVSETLTMLRHWMPQVTGIETLQAIGSFNFDLRAQGVHLPTRSSLPEILESAECSLHDVQISPNPGTPPIGLEGSALYENNQIIIPRLDVKLGTNDLFFSGRIRPWTQPMQFSIGAQNTSFDFSGLIPYIPRPYSRPNLLSGIGTLRVSAFGDIQNPVFSLQAAIPKGHLFHYPFQDALLSIRQIRHRWELTENHLHIFDGQIALKGFLSQNSSSLQWTAQNLSLQELFSNPKQNGFSGRIDAAFTTQGPADSLNTRGTFWARDLQWGTMKPENLRGELESSADLLQVQAASDDNQFYLNGRALRRNKAMDLQNATLHLRSGGELQAHGKWLSAEGVMHLTLKAQGIQIPTDIPFMPALNSAGQGHFDFNGSIDGSLSQWVLQGQSAGRIQLGGFAETPVQMTLRATPEEVFILSFSLDPGIRGSLRHTFSPKSSTGFELTLDHAPMNDLNGWISPRMPLQGQISGQLHLMQSDTWTGEGALHLENGVAGAWSIPHADAEAKILKNHIVLQTLSFQTAHARSVLQGDADWKYSETIGLTEMPFHIHGEITSLAGPSAWACPVQMTGSLHRQKSWQGKVSIHASTVLIHNHPTRPLEGQLQWTPEEVKWTDFHWGSEVSSEGSLHLAHERVWSGTLRMKELSLAEWQSWFWPFLREPLEGRLSGIFAISGLIENPQTRFTAMIRDGRWRAFQFNSRLSGIGDRTQVDPIVLDGDLTNGGHFHFQGRFLPQEGTAAGSLSFSDMALSPLGKSLSFPNPLEGRANGTVTIFGPVNQPRVEGHLETGTVLYGKTGKTPLKLKSSVMDFTLAPSSEHAGATQLTVTQAVVKTEEEEIRLNAGSSIEFSGTQQASLDIRTELRNVHLGLMTFFGGLDLKGTWQIKPEGFAIHADAHTRSLYINAYELDEGHINADYYDGVLTFSPPAGHTALMTGSVDFKRYPQFRFANFAMMGKEGQFLNLSGEVGPAQWDFRMLGHGLDINTLGGLAEFPYTLEGTADLNIRGTGNMHHPRVEGNIQLADGQLSILHFKTGDAHLLWQGNRMIFTHLVLSDPGRYTISGAGVFPIRDPEVLEPEDPTINFSLRLQNTNLSLLQSLTPEVKKARGAVEGLLQIQGTSHQPLLRGSLHVANGDIDGAHYFRHLQNITLGLDFDGHALTVHDFKAQSGSGQIQGGGRIVFSGFKPQMYDLHLAIPSSKGIEFQVPELAIPDSPLSKNFSFLTSLSRGMVKGHLSFKGPADAPVLSGLATISNGHFTFPPSSKNPPPPSFVEWVRQIIWDVHLKFGEAAWFDNELVEASLLGGFHISGPSGQLQVDGGLDIPEGKISYLGIDFDIQQARFDIHPQQEGNTFTNIPYVRGVAESKVQTVDSISGQSIDDTITLTIDYAPINDIKPRLVSSLDPTLAPDKVLSRVTQLDVQNMTPQERTYLYQQQMVRLVDTSLATPLARNLLKRTGLIDEFQVSHAINPTNTYLPNDPNNPLNSPQQSPVSLMAGTKYTLAKNLSNRLSLGYGLRFEQYTTTELENKLDLRSDVELSYRMLKNVYLRGVFDLPTTTPGALIDRKITIEPRWRFGWWGNTNPPKRQPLNTSSNSSATP